MLSIDKPSDIFTLQPIQQDYSDVYNVMAFFAGPPVADSHGLHIDTSRGNNDLARKIGENAERFVQTMWRWEDMQVYVCFYWLLLCCDYAHQVNPFRCTGFCLSMGGW